MSPCLKGHPKWQALLQAILKLNVDYTPDMVTQAMKLKIDGQYLLQKQQLLAK